MHKPFVICFAGTAEVVGELESFEICHLIAHLYLTEWPDLAPLVLSDRSDVEDEFAWLIGSGCCHPLSCGVALMDANFAESKAAAARGEYLTLKEVGAILDLPPSEQDEASEVYIRCRMLDRGNTSGLPVRIPSTGPSQRVDMVLDPELLRRVVERLRRVL